MEKMFPTKKLIIFFINGSGFKIFFSISKASKFSIMQD
jgi:hypothetical protein